jgi:hemerythrin
MLADSFLEWNSEFETGIAAVDFEHQRMIELINELLEVLDGAPSRAAVAGFLGEIHARIASHFLLEEQIMREYRYDQYVIHKADHERLLEEIRDIMDEVEDDFGTDFRVALEARLPRWFAVHFKTQDARFHRLLGEH